MPHCSLATLIGLCLRIKIERNIAHQLKLDIYIKKGAHSTEDESKSQFTFDFESFEFHGIYCLIFSPLRRTQCAVNKQINDKERIAAAMENPNLKNLVEQCIQEE